MSREGYQGPKLPKSLLDKVQNGNAAHGKRSNVSRKDRRKAERQQKKIQRHPPKIAPQSRPTRRGLDAEDGNGSYERDGASPPEPPAPPRPAKNAIPVKSILKKSKPLASPLESESEIEDEEIAPIISRAVKERLQDDDAEIAALERRLGIKGKKSKALQEDGLDWIAEGSDEDAANGLKRKRPEDLRWLRDKRRKASAVAEVDSEDADTESETDLEGVEDEEEIENPFSDDETDSDDFEGFESEELESETHPPPKKRRENPYVPPVVDDAAPTTKYIPPSLRAPAPSDEETLQRLRKQVQGLLNRLSESNMASILHSVEELYSRNARQHVTSTLIDLLVGLVADPSVLNDAFLTLHAGFSAGVYKVVGTDFGAQLLENLVERFDSVWKSNALGGKQAVNLLAFLCNLYTFQLVGSALIFDYVRLLLDELSETNTELLLRVIRTCGQSLRQDDPSALKDIVLLLQRSVAKIGEANVSARTKYMIETINDLKNNRVRTSASSTLSAEQSNRMKKTLSSLSSSRPIKSTEPLRITLADIRDREKKGRWWLVGASYLDPAKVADDSSSALNKRHLDNEDAGYESETPGSVNLHKLARAQGMNTDVRRAIFIATLSSADYQEAHMRLLKLHLKSKQMLEIPRVLTHCTGAEETYNPFYALVASKFCGDHKMRKAFEFSLWDALRQMAGGDDRDDGAEEMGVRKIVNLAKFYGTLIAEGGLSVRVLKKVEFAYLERNAEMFVEVLLTAIFVQVRRKHTTDVAFGDIVKGVFMQAAGNSDLIQGLRYVLETRISMGELASGKKERKAVGTGCDVALEALDEAAKVAPFIHDEQEDESD